MEYEEYLQSAEWKQKARVAKARAGNRCQLCNANDKESILHVHHRTYERLGNEEPADLTVLCSFCHAAFHAQPWKPGQKGLERMLRKNGILPLKELSEDTHPWNLYEKAKRLTKRWLLGNAIFSWPYYNECMRFVVNYLGV